MQLLQKVLAGQAFKGVKDNVDYYRGSGVDIHKAIGKLPKPKGGFTLPGHNYTGPYNPLEKQLRYDPTTGEILEFYVNPTGKTDAIAAQHDVDYSVCRNNRKCKNKADRKITVYFICGVKEHEASRKGEFAILMKNNSKRKYFVKFRKYSKSFLLLFAY